jgi:hypothetical protein
MHKSYFLAFFAYLGFKVANIFTSVYLPSELITQSNASLLLGVWRVFRFSK